MIVSFRCDPVWWPRVFARARCSLPRYVWLFSGFLEHRVDEWGEGGTLGEDEDEAEEDRKEEDRQQPPFFSNTEEEPEVTEEREFGHTEERSMWSFAVPALTCPMNPNCIGLRSSRDGSAL